MVEFKGYALIDPAAWSTLQLVSFVPKDFKQDDVEIAITHCGICGSDVHTLTQSWGKSKLPLIVGHEIVGIVTRVGANVSEFKPGDRVGVGAQVASCGKCASCKQDDENYCMDGTVHTYNDEYPDGVVTQGGYSTGIRAHQQFVFKIPEEIESKDAASMFCAGLTVFAPLYRHGTGPGKKVGIMGIGGLGHFAIMFAKALGAEVYVFTHSPCKADDARKMGADHVIDTHDDGFYRPLVGTLDLFLSTIDVFRPDRPFRMYFSMLRVHGKYVNVGLPDGAGNPLPPLNAFDLLTNAAFLGGSHLGSKSDCYAMLRLVAEKGIRPWVQELPMSEVGVALEAVQRGEAKYRYVLKQDIVPVPLAL